jgi:hypothetical protein
MTYGEARETVSKRLRLGDATQIEAMNFLESQVPLQALAKQAEAKVCERCKGDGCWDCKHTGIAAKQGVYRNKLFRATNHRLRAIVDWIRDESQHVAAPPTEATQSVMEELKFETVEANEESDPWN